MLSYLQMGSEYSNPSKLHYDITMSKRTRKPPNHLAKEADDQKNCYPFKASTPEEEQNSTKDVNEEAAGEKSADCNEEEEEENDHKSLKQLIKERSSLGQHFTAEEEKQQQHHLQVLAIKPHDEENLEGLTLKRLVSRYARVLSRLIKVKKQDSRMGMGSRNKPPLRFPK